MSYEEKLKKSKELIELTGSGKRVEFAAPTSEHFRAIREEQDRRLLALSIELSAKHRSEEQIDALLNFYKSDIGRSILKTNKIISEEFRERFNETMSMSASSEGGAGLVSCDPGDIGKRNT